MLHDGSSARPEWSVAADVDAGRELGVLAVAAPTLPPAAVGRLPRGGLAVPELDEDPFWRLASAFLVECRRGQTRRAYSTELKAWYACRRVSGSSNACLDRN